MNDLKIDKNSRAFSYYCLVGMLHPKVFDYVRSNLKYFKCGISEGNYEPIERSVLDVLDDEAISSESISDEIIKDKQKINGVTEEESKYFFSVYNAIKDEDDINYLKSQLDDFYCKGLLRYASRSSNDNREIVDFIREDAKINNLSNEFPIKTFEELNVAEAVEKYDPEKVIKSRYHFINNCTTAGGYLMGQLVQVIAKPSVGKSLWMMGEALNFIKQGKKVHYLALGDLTESDFIIRLLTIHYGVSWKEVEANIMTYWLMALNEKVFDGLLITHLPSGTLSPSRYIDNAKTLLAECDVFVVDYDSNFEQRRDSMYIEGGNLYDKLTELKDLGKLVFVASQPKREYYREEIIPGDASVESSRKYHIADLIITIGKNPTAYLPMGRFTVGKNRRGDEPQGIPWIRTLDGVFYECSEGFYLSNLSLLTQMNLSSNYEILDPYHDPKLDSENVQVDKIESKDKPEKVINKEETKEESKEELVEQKSESESEKINPTETTNTIKGPFGFDANNPPF